MDPFSHSSHDATRLLSARGWADHREPAHADMSIPAGEPDARSHLHSSRTVRPSPLQPPSRPPRLTEPNPKKKRTPCSPVRDLRDPPVFSASARASPAWERLRRAVLARLGVGVRLRPPLLSSIHVYNDLHFRLGHSGCSQRLHGARRWARVGPCLAPLTSCPDRRRLQKPSRPSRPSPRPALVCAPRRTTSPVRLSHPAPHHTQPFGSFPYPPSPTQPTLRPAMSNQATVSPPVKRKLQRWLAATPRLFSFAPDASAGSSSPGRADRTAPPQLPALARQGTFRPFGAGERGREVDSWELHVRELAEGGMEEVRARERRAGRETQVRGLGESAGGDEAEGAQPPVVSTTRRWSLRRTSSSSNKQPLRMRRSMSSSSTTSRWSFLSINTSNTAPPQGDSSPPISHEGPSSSPAHDLAPLLPPTPTLTSSPEKAQKAFYRHSMDVPGISAERLRGGGRKEGAPPSLSPGRLSAMGASIDTTLDADGRRVLMSKRRKSLDPTWAEGGDLRDVPIISQPPVKVKLNKHRFGIGEDDDDANDQHTQDETGTASPATPSSPSHTPPSWLSPPELSPAHDAWAGSSWTGSIIVSSPGALSPVGGVDVSPSAEGLDTLVENHSWSTVTSRTNYRRWSAAPAMPAYGSSAGYIHPRDRSEEYYRNMLPPPRPLYDHPLAAFTFPSSPSSASPSSSDTIKTNFPLASAPPVPTSPGSPVFKTPSRHLSVLRRANKPIARAQTLSVAPPAFSTFERVSAPGSPTGSVRGPPLPSPTAVTFKLPEGQEAGAIVRRVTSPTPPRAGVKAGWARPRGAAGGRIEGARGRREGSNVSVSVEELKGRLFVANPDASSDSDEDEDDSGPATLRATPSSRSLRPLSLPPHATPPTAGPASFPKTGSGARLGWKVDNTLHPSDYRTLGVGQVGMAY